MTTPSTCKGMRRRTKRMCCSSFRVGITTLTDGLPDAASAVEIKAVEIKPGRWIEIGNCITTGFMAGIEIRPTAPPPPRALPGTHIGITGSRTKQLSNYDLASYAG